MSSSVSGPSRSSQESPRMLSSRSSSGSESRSSITIKRSYSTKKESMNGPLYRQTVNRTVLVRRLKRKGDGPSKQLARWFVENQIGTNSPLMPSPATRTSTQPLSLSPKNAAPRHASRKNFSRTPCRVTRPKATITQHAVYFSALSTLHNHIAASWLVQRYQDHC